MRRGVAVTLLMAAGCATTSAGSGGDTPDLQALADAEARRDALAPAVQAALHDPDPNLRKTGLWVLGRVEEVGTSSLAAPLLMDADAEVAAAAAFALGQIGESAGEAALLAALRHTRAPQAALRALSRVGTASVAPHLVAFLGHADPDVRAEAVLALGLLKKRLPALEVTFEPAVAALLQDPSPRVRFGAAYALARSAGPVAASALVTALADPDPEVRMWAATGLGKAGASPQVLDPVMRDPDWRVRAAAATALGAMGAAGEAEGPHAATRLSALASVAFARVAKGEPLAAGRGLHVLYAAIDAAAGFPAGKKVLDEVEHATWEGAEVDPAASTDVAHVQCAVAIALDRLEGAARRIETCGKGAFPEWRRRSAWLELTAAAGGAGAVEKLAPFARDPEPRIRAAAVLALGEVKTRASTKVLLDLLGSNDPYVLGAAAETLARPDRAGLRPPALPERLGDVLAQLVAQPDASLVVGLLDAVGKLGPAGAPLVGTLDKLRHDPRAAVRRRAAQAMAALTGRKVPFGPRTGPAPVTPAPRPEVVR
ncbi:MAG: HEAT repeat domain-containing protein, partial [Myxococcales bacterium]|nr:HEAT repeat domain-containing protein [Myxococcales bacterium]